MLASPHFFGADDRARFGFLHWPTGPVLGAAVVCPPLAYEQVCAYRTLRFLAENLAAAGLVTLRIDYDGTGNSMGSADDPDRLAAWQNSIADAVAELRGFGIDSVTLIGVRFGATMAAAAAAAGQSNGVAGLVLWDPIESGRRYAKELRLMSATGQGHLHRDAGVAVAGIEFTEQTLAGLREVRLIPPPLGVDTLVIARAENSDADAPFEDGVLSPSLQMVRLRGTSALLDSDAERAVVPTGIVAAIRTWMVQHCSAPLIPQPRRPMSSTVVVQQTPAGVVRHEALRIGSSGLFAVQTVRADARPIRAVVMVNNGVASHVGPGRAWIEFAVRCAEIGWLALRLDFAGLGDSPSRPGRPEQDSYPVTAGLDLREAVEHLKSIGIEHVAIVGLCSGALLAFDGALAAPEIDLLLGINGRFDKPFVDSRGDRRLRASAQTTRLLALPLTKSPLFPLFDAVPTWVWRSLDRLHLVAAPTRVIERLLKRGGTRIVMLFGTEELGLRALRRRGGRRFNRLLFDPSLTLVEVPGLDHSMFNAAAREAVERQLLAMLQRLDEQSNDMR